VAFSITQATPTVDVTDAGGTYDSLPYAASGTVTGVNDANLGTPVFTYYSGTHTLAGLSGLTALLTTPVNVGNYTVLASYSATTDYAAASAIATFTISATTPMPTVTGISPASGSTNGGATVTITGTNLASAIAVDFGSTPASIVSDAADQIVATSPAESAGTVDVTVATAGGTSATSSSDRFSYAAPSFALSGPTSGTYTVGQTVTFQWTAANVDAGSTISLAYDTTTNWGNPKWTEIDAVVAADGADSYTWNTSGAAPGTYYLAGYMLDSGRPYLSHLTTSITIAAVPAPSFVLSGPASGSYVAGQTVTFQWTAAHVDGGSTISLAYDTTTTWGNAQWAELDAVVAANGAGSYAWNTTGVAPGTYYLAGYLFDSGKFYVSRLASPITITAAATPTFALSSPASATYAAGQTVTFQWTAADVDAGSKISLAYDTTTNWGNPTWIEIDGVTAANGAGSHDWNTTGIAPGTYYLAGYLYDSGKFHVSHLVSAITILPTPSFTLNGPTSGTYIVGQTVTFQWTAANVEAGSKISLAYDTTTNWGNPTWVEINVISAADGTGSYAWNTAGVAPGNYYLAGYLDELGSVFSSHLVSAITIAPVPSPSFTISGPTSGVYDVGQTVTIQWTAANVDAGSKISLAYDTTTNWGNVKWVEVDGVTAADGAASYMWNTTGVAPGTYYLAGYLYDSGKFYYSHLFSTITVTLA
jgi:hypothetical protein